MQKKIYVAFLHCKTDAACLDRELNKLTTYFCNAVKFCNQAVPRTGCCVIQLPVVVVRRRVVTNKRQGRSLQAGPTDFCRIQQAPNGFMLRNPLRKTLLIVFYTAWKANFRWKSILSIRYTMTSIFTRLRLSFINSQKLRCGYLIQHLSLPTRVFVPGQANNGHK